MSDVKSDLAFLHPLSPCVLIESKSGVLRCFSSGTAFPPHSFYQVPESLDSNHENKKKIYWRYLHVRFLFSIRTFVSFHGYILRIRYLYL